MKAKAGVIARSVKKHRVFFLFVMGLFTVGLLAGVYAVQTSPKWDGQINPGDHEFWAMSDVASAAFCSNCHNAIGVETAASVSIHSKSSQCVNCHKASNSEHAANQGKCTDCHSGEAIDLESDTEGHNGLMAQLGESSADAGRTCISCHTHAAVEVTVSAVGQPILLDMAG